MVHRRKDQINTRRKGNVDTQQFPANQICYAMLILKTVKRLKLFQMTNTIASYLIQFFYDGGRSSENIGLWTLNPIFDKNNFTCNMQ